MSRPRVVVSVAATVAVIVNSTAWAVTRVSNLGETSAGQATIDAGTSGMITFMRGYGGSFVAGDAANITNVVLNWGGGFSTPPPVRLQTDINGIPGSTLLTFTASSDPQVAGLATYVAPSPYPLVAGSTYWITATAGFVGFSNQHYWFYTNSSISIGDPGWSIGSAAGYSYFSGPQGSGGGWSPIASQHAMFSVGVAGLAGDFNGDSRVDAGDYVTWRKGSGFDYSTWRAHFGESTSSSGQSLAAISSVPEPATLSALTCSAIFCFITSLGRRAGRSPTRNACV